MVFFPPWILVFTITSAENSDVLCFFFFARMNFYKMGITIKIYYIGDIDSIISVVADTCMYRY